MNKDTIYREDAIKAIFSKPACHGSDGSWYHSDDIRNAINNTPSADRPQGEWISTNGNNLPRPFQSVLVCNEFGDIEIGYLKEEWFWKKDGTFLILCPVAWMPLPTAYKERSRR